MTNGVGLWIGASESTAVIVRDTVDADGNHPSGAGTDHIVRETVLYMSENGTAIGGPGTDEATPISDFADRVGDPEGITLDDGIAYQAEDLYATALFCMLDLATANLAGDTQVIAAYPPGWSDEIRGAVRDSLDYLGLRHVRLQPAQHVPAPTSDAASDNPAHAAALAAVVAPNEPPTEEIPVIAIPADEYAYSAVMPALPAALDVVSDPVANPIRRAESGTARHSRTPLLVAAGFAGAFALIGATAAVALRADPTPAIPTIMDAAAAPAVPKQPAPAALAPVAFPTAAPIAFPTVAPIAFPTVEAAAPTAPTSAWTPEAGPAPVLEIAAPVTVAAPMTTVDPAPTTTTESTPTTTTPATRTTTTTTTSPAASTPTETTTQPEHYYVDPSNESTPPTTTDHGYSGNAGFEDPWFTEPDAGRSAGTDTGADRSRSFDPFPDRNEFFGYPAIPGYP